VPGFVKVSLYSTNNIYIYDDPSPCTYQPEPTILSSIGTFLQQRFNGVGAAPSYPRPAQSIVPKRIFTGASERGCKFTPLFGRILVDLATTEKTFYDISAFSITRKLNHQKRISQSLVLARMRPKWRTTR
jgi:hypothetical protein